MARFVLCSLVALTIFTQVTGNIRGAREAPEAVHHSIMELQAAVLDELTASIGEGQWVSQQNRQAIESVLNTSFASMPKNEFGKLDHNAVRYLVHRYFTRRHNIHIKGLEPEAGGEHVDLASIDIVADKVPAVVQNLFESRLAGKGMGLHEIAILSATLEHLMQNEATDRLREVYNFLGTSTDQRLDESTSELATDMYMLKHVLGKAAAKIRDLNHFRLVLPNAARLYPGWPSLQQLRQNVLDSMLAAKDKDPNFTGGQVSFQGMVQVVQEITDKFGSHQNLECKAVKEHLMKKEDRGSGRVSLVDFYAEPDGDAMVLMTETEDYLRQLGVLEETGGHKNVIIPNYVNSKSNCIETHSMYSVCCQNECEDLLDQLERQILRPAADPTLLSELVAQLPSATQSAPRTLSADLLQRLNGIAAQHGGEVPLHGRLFSQWMHHAFPRECPYPHLTGEVSPMTSSEWTSGGKRSSLTQEQHLALQRQPPIAQPRPEVTLPWTDDEELKVSRPSARSGRLSSASVICIIAAAAFLASMSQPLALGYGLATGKVGRRDGLLPMTKLHVS